MFWSKFSLDPNAIVESIVNLCAASYPPISNRDSLSEVKPLSLAKLRTSSAGASAIYKKEASAKMRNAKIRLSNMKSKEITQVLRGKSKWIKH